MASRENRNGNLTRDMAAPASESQVAPTRFWVLEVLISVFALVVTGTYQSIKNFIIAFMKTKKSVKGKVVVVTGSGRGLGRGIAMKLSRLGAHVACVDINAKNNEETAELIKQEGGTAQAYHVNVAKSQQIEQFARDVEKKLGPVDIVINNAGLVMAVPIDDMSYDDIRGFFEVNCMAAAFMTKAFISDMRKRNSGHIVSISSIAARSCLPWLTLYCSTKAGLTKFMDTLHVELNMTPNNKIKVTTIHPYFINTSADYFRWFRAPTPILQEETVVDAVIDSILYEKSSVFVPSMFSILNILDGVLPLHYHNLNIKFLGRDIKIPLRKERDTLPYANIVNQTVADSK